MYTIETELGRFSGDTEKEAKRAMRKAAKEQVAKDAAENEVYNRAMLLAKANGFRILERFVSRAIPNAWRVHELDERGFTRKIYSEQRAQWGARIECGGCDSESGDVFPYDPITHYISSGSGYAIAIRIANQDCELFAVGCHEGRIAWVALPGVKLTDFVKAGE